MIIEITEVNFAVRFSPVSGNNMRNRKFFWKLPILTLVVMLYCKSTLRIAHIQGYTRYHVRLWAYNTNSTNSYMTLLELYGVFVAGYVKLCCCSQNVGRNMLIQCLVKPYPLLPQFVSSFDMNYICDSRFILLYSIVKTKCNISSMFLRNKVSFK